MNKYIEAIEKIKNKSEDIKELYNIFISFGDPIIIPLILPTDLAVLRGRINENGQVFFKKSDLGTVPAVNCKKYQRANVPYSPMFYACSFPINDKRLPPRGTVLFENSKFSRIRNLSGYLFITYSRWEIKKNLKLLCIPINKEYANPGEEVDEISKIWNKYKVGISKEKIDFIEYMSKLLATEAKFDNDYYIIANYIHYLLYVNEKTKEFDGIAYPSVYMKGESFNIALKPTSVEDKLILHGGGINIDIKKESNNKIISIYTFVANEDGTLTYKFAPQIDPIYILNELKNITLFNR
jgi:hypothetical protein